MKSTKQQSIEGKFQHVFYSPKGKIDGMLMDVEGEAVQVVFDRHDNDSPNAFLSFKPGKLMVVKVTTKSPAIKGVRAHLIYKFIQLVSVAGRKPDKHKSANNGACSGNVAYFNYARHGEANGMVLDSGDFIHLNPAAFSMLSLKVGDKVRANGKAHGLHSGTGMILQATRLNGKNVEHG